MWQHVLMTDYNSTYSYFSAILLVLIMTCYTDVSHVIIAINHR